MIRRIFAGLILGPSLLLASLAWTGFLALNTALDPARSERVANDLYDDELVREQLASNLAGAFQAALPEQVSIPRVQMERVAFDLLGNEAVKTVFVDSLVDVHQAFLGEGELPTTVDATPIAQSLRSALVAQQPELDALLPAGQGLRVDLPVDRIPDASPLRSFLQRAVPLLAVLAFAGVGLALLSTSDRPSVLRRAGFWCLSASATVLIIGIGVPWLARQVIPDQAEIFAVLVGALLAATLPPSIALAIVGVGLVIVASVVRASQGSAAPRERRVEQRRAADSQASAGAGGGWNVGPPVGQMPQPAPAPAPAPVGAYAPHPTQPGYPPGAPAAWPQQAPTTGLDAVSPPLDQPPTTAMPVTQPPVAPAVSPPPENFAPDPDHPTSPMLRTTPEPPVPGTPADAHLAPRWMENVGWVQHPDDSRTVPGARWEPGVGYVLPAAGPADPGQER